MMCTVFLSKQEAQTSRTTAMEALRFLLHDDACPVTDWLQIIRKVFYFPKSPDITNDILFKYIEKRVQEGREEGDLSPTSLALSPRGTSGGSDPPENPGGPQVQRQ
jgi:hypothetical protein